MNHPTTTTSTTKQKHLKEVARLSKSIRQKYLDLKRGLVEKEHSLHETFKPILKPLETLLEQRQQQQQQVVSSSDDKPSPPPSPLLPQKEEDETEAVKIKRERKIPKRKLVMAAAAEEEVFEATPEKSVQAALEETLMGDEEGLTEMKETLHQFGERTRYYLTLFTMNDNTIDRSTHGIQYRTQGGLGLGNTSIQFTPYDEIVLTADNGLSKTYEGTTGLFQLLFLRQPDENTVTADDMKNYKDILEFSNATRRHYSLHKQKQGLRTEKYRKYIRGSGGFKDYLRQGKQTLVYWNDVNELVSRLKLLIRSEAAGHSGLGNEQISIIEELREEGIID